MAWDTGSPVSNTPTEYICDRIKNNIGIGSLPLRNWSFVENIPAVVGIAEVQQLVLTGWGTGDTFRLTFNGHETTDISYGTGATVATAIAAALNALSDFNTPNTVVTCSYISGTTWNISNNNATKWFGIPFNVVGLFSVTNAVGCSGSISQITSPEFGTGSVSYSADIFKCTGSGDDVNDAAIDFYIFVTRDVSATATVLIISVIQDWSITYHKGRKFVDLHAGSGSPYHGVDADGWADQYNSLNYYLINTIISYATCRVFTLNKTGFLYQLKMTKNFIFLTTRVGTTETNVYIGLFDSLVVQGDTYPIIMASGTLFDSAYGGFVNLPGLSGVISPGVPNSFGGKFESWTLGASIAVSNDNNLFDKWANNGIWVSRVAILHMVSSVNHYIWGKLRGLLKSDILAVYKSGTTCVIGDTMTIDGTTYIVMGSLGAELTTFVQAN